MAVPYTFANATTTIPLSELDANFNTPFILGSTEITLGDTVSTVEGLDFSTASFSTEAYFLSYITVDEGNIYIGHGDGSNRLNSIAIGATNLSSNTTGEENTAIGTGCLGVNTTGDYNTTIGSYSLVLNTTGDYNTALGSNVLSVNTTGSNNLSGGYLSLNANQTGSFNVAFGNSALNLSTSSSSTAIGYFSLKSNTSGSTNTAIGRESGYGSGTNANTTGSNNTFIGYSSVGASATASNVITLGNAAIATLRCQVTTITSLSDARDKTNIVDIPAGLSFIEALRPVSFDWNMRDGAKVGINEFGFIAQELLSAQNQTGITVPNLVSEENPDKLEASAGVLIPVLVKAIQELKAELDLLKSKVGA